MKNPLMITVSRGFSFSPGACRIYRLPPASTLRSITAMLHLDSPIPARSWLPVLLLCTSLLTGCSLPAQNLTESFALSPESARATRLGQALAADVAAHPGQSGIHALSDPHAAFAARVLLARTAERTLDVQYYIWHGDRSEEHTSELQSRENLVCRLLLE